MIALAFFGSSQVTAPLSPPAAHAQPPPFARFHVRAKLRPPELLAKEIAELRAALSRPQSTDFSRADLLFQLGEAQDQLRRGSKPQSETRKTASEAALESYRSLIEEVRFRGYPGRDRALFAVAYLLYEEERTSESQSFFQRLLDEHPDSSLAAEAAVGRAESFFEARDLNNALRYYQMAAAHSDSPLAGYALDKSGWVYINLGQTDKALGAFQEVLALGSAGKLPPSDAAPLMAEAELGLKRARRK